MPEVIEAPAKEVVKPTSSDSNFNMLIENFEKNKGETKNADSPIVDTPVIDANDLTESFKEKFAPLQKEGNVEAINKLREEIQEAVKTGKKVSPELMAQLEVPVDMEAVNKQKIANLEVEKQKILTDAKLTKEQRDEAIAKLEVVTTKKKYWEEPDFVEAPITADQDAEKRKLEDLQKSYEVKAKQYDAIESDSFIKAYLSAKESGKPVAEFLSELGKDNPAGLTAEQILEKRIAREGLTADEAEEERDSYKALSPIAKKEFIAKERALLNKDYQSNFEKYSSSTTAEREKTISVAKQSIKDRSDYLAKIENQEVWGIKYDSTQISKLNDYAANIMENGLFTKDGTWDVPRIMRLGMMELNMKHMLQKAHESGKTENAEEFFQKYGRPSINNGISGKPDASFLNKEKTDDQKSKEKFQENRGIKTVQFT